MVTMIVIRMGEKASPAEDDSNRDDGEDNRLQKNNQDHEDDKKHGSKPKAGGGEGGHQHYSFKTCQHKAADRGVCDGHSSYHDNESPTPSVKVVNDDTVDDGKAAAADVLLHMRRHNNTKKRPALLVKDVGDTEERKRRKKGQKKQLIDLTDVPAQPPILKSNGKDGTSKYQGVSLHKSVNKWNAQITLDGKKHSIGYYANEEQAAVDYARARFKYKAGNAKVCTTSQVRRKLIDLTDVPTQLPIISSGRDGTSKYQGVTFVKATNEWRAQIMLDGKRHHIGLYDNEEQAGIDYARAMFKYRVGNHKRERRQHAIDLTDVPLQSLILNCGYGSSSKYEGVSLNKSTNKWKAQITISGKSRYIGTYDSEEEAAVDYARAVFKYSSGDCRRQDASKEKAGPRVIDVTNTCPTTAEMLERSMYQGRVKGNI